jgi:hypothetical protein
MGLTPCLLYTIIFAYVRVINLCDRSITITNLAQSFLAIHFFGREFLKVKVKKKKKEWKQE